MQTALSVVFLGMSGVGKTAIIRSALNNQQEIFPTAGLQVNYITSTSKTLLVYDCSGEGTARKNWSILASLAETIVYVIDSYSHGSFYSAKKYLYSFLEQHPIMRRKSICIMLNKCDRKNRPPKELFVRALETEKLTKLVQKFYIKETSAFNKEGIDQCLEWIIKNSAGDIKPDH